MGSLKKYLNMPANSLLESIIALSIISICLYVGIIVYAAVFNNNTSARFYSNQNKTYDAFFMLQLGLDSITENKTNWEIDREAEGNITLVNIKYSDSIQVYPVKTFYIINE